MGYFLIFFYFLAGEELLLEVLEIDTTVALSDLRFSILGAEVRFLLVCFLRLGQMTSESFLIAFEVKSIRFCSIFIDKSRKQDEDN
jgi:hypothetical protein